MNSTASSAAEWEWFTTSMEQPVPFPKKLKPVNQNQNINKQTNARVKHQISYFLDVTFSTK